MGVTFTESAVGSWEQGPSPHGSKFLASSGGSSYQVLTSNLQIILLFFLRSAQRKSILLDNKVCFPLILSSRIENFILIGSILVRHGHPYLLRSEPSSFLGYIKPKCYFLCYVTIKNRIMKHFLQQLHVYLD